MSDSVRPHRRQPTRLPRPWDSPGKNAGVGCHFLLQCVKVKSESEVAESCITLSDPMDCSPPGSSVHGIFQARVLEWGAIAFSVIGYIPIQTKKLKKKITACLGWRCSLRQELPQGYQYLLLPRLCFLYVVYSTSLSSPKRYEKVLPFISIRRWGSERWSNSP